MNDEFSTKLAIGDQVTQRESGNIDTLGRTDSNLGGEFNKEFIFQSDLSNNKNLKKIGSHGKKDSNSVVNVEYYA